MLIPVCERLLGPVPNLGDVHDPERVIDAVNDPVDMWSIAVEQVMKVPVFWCPFCAPRESFEAEDRGL